MRARNSITLQFRAESFDFPDGSVDAGTVMSWIDKAGYAAAATWSGSNVVSSYIGNMRFAHKVPVESRVLVQARLIHTGNVSIHVQTRVVLPDVLDDDGEPTVCTHCIMVFVAVDDQDKPIPVRKWEPVNEQARARAALAAERAAAHRAGEDALDTAAFPPAEETTAEVVTLRFIANSRDVYPGEKVQGGGVMRWIDEAANVCAARWTGQRVVAVFAGGVRFYNPVRVRELLEIEARLVHTTSRSVYVVIRAWAGSRRNRELDPIAHGVSVLVTTGEDGRAQEVPQWTPSTPAELTLEKMCVDLVALRNRVVYAWARNASSMR